MVRFLGLKEPNDPNSELVQLRFICLVVGLRPSPAILSLTIPHHLETQKDANPQLIEVSSNAKLIMQKGAFNLRKRNTNSSNLKEMFSEESSPKSTNLKPVTEEAESYAKTLTGTLIKTYNNIIKVLGSIWNTASDSLEFNYYQVG